MRSDSLIYVGADLKVGSYYKNLLTLSAFGRSDWSEGYADGDSPAAVEPQLARLAFAAVVDEGRRTSRTRRPVAPFRAPHPHLSSWGIDTDLEVSDAGLSKPGRPGSGHCNEHESNECELLHLESPRWYEPSHGCE
jgi:hypothetical protein